jgi:Transcriptional Coactivator p15 (PC4)
MGAPGDRLAAVSSNDLHHGRRSSMSRRPTLTEPVEVAKFFKNRRKDVIVVSLSTFEGRNIVDVRQHFHNEKGRMRPTGKGVAMVVLRLPELHAAITKALAKARELGLLDDVAAS